VSVCAPPSRTMGSRGACVRQEEKEKEEEEEEEEEDGCPCPPGTARVVVGHVGAPRFLVRGVLA
ncbi:MAG TPA: hypothetical protein VMN39_10135, partial [Longimicrobiaceae bacterium]|nr:hypothetical protein [Longimicrobiaceae bacterium]